MTQKNVYRAPQLYEVKLDRDQAILSACSLTATTLSNGMPGGCRPAAAATAKTTLGAVEETAAHAHPKGDSAMTEKKAYTSPQLYEVTLDRDQAILTSCSTATISSSAGGSVGCRPPTGCMNYPNASPVGCKRSVLPVTYMNRTCHDSGPRPS